jgi:hypothetical protein
LEERPWGITAPLSLSIIVKGCPPAVRKNERKNKIDGKCFIKFNYLIQLVYNEKTTTVTASFPLQ